ncbi:hypothetical protein CH354_11315 [Leptospira levettii]|uniref:hypothetical protein n=1 Tax=Leptospira levettii TaxID=2023178 RepID=UPI000C2AC540|nr:hypothetical protein [Leptospira levettii]MCW7475208.1 hypothetical protein [Leptospira levettii]PJZ36695.1 hypothetical protein CH354_11315 [Leptospira levettii]PJZ89751.1 hypothetical protein CH368_05185 [Leptospira levettii]PKA00265.1 hypothetical protein CH369_12125 [Leptospira levettii]
MKWLSILAVAFVVNCSYKVGNFKEVSLEAPSNLEVVGTGTVEGRECGFSLFNNTWYNQNIAAAARDALSYAPGATGLKDVTIKGKHGVFLFLNCVYVEGTPVVEKAAGKKK